MSFEAIPVEILMMIFKILKGTDAAACRAVCRRWRDAVDSLTDDAWGDFCYRDFGNPKIATDVSNLSYWDLYKSLALWSKVEEADEKCSTKPVKVYWFKVLNNNTVAVIRTSQKIDNIEYYNTQTMTVISRRSFNFYIFRCDENENLIAMMDEDSRIHIIIKSNNREFVVGEQDEISNFTLLDTELYFKSRQSMLYVARLKVVDGGEKTVETVELNDLEEQVVAFARAGDDGVNILTYERNIYSYCFGTTEFTWRVQFKYYPKTDFRIYVELRRFGFQWSNAKIYEWLSDTYTKEQLKISELYAASIHIHNHVLLLGTNEGFVHVYKRPYNENGELKTYQSKADRTIDMFKYSELIRTGRWSRRMGCIKQVDVVEILHGHRLFIMNEFNWLIIIDLLHSCGQQIPKH